METTTTWAGRAPGPGDTGRWRSEVGRRESVAHAMARSATAAIAPRPRVRVMLSGPTNPSEEDPRSLAAAAFEHHRNAPLHLLDFRLEDGVLLVGRAFEAHRLPEMNAVLHG